MITDKRFVGGILGGLLVILIMAFLFINNIDQGQALEPDCVVPTSGMEITEDTVFCSGIHQVHGINVQGTGTAGDPLEITCQPGTIFDGATLYTPEFEPNGISMKGSGQPGDEWTEYVEISGCTFQNYEVAIANGRYITVENSRFIDIHRHSFMAQDYYFVRNNYFHNDIMPHSGISFFASHSVLEGNFFDNTNGNVVFETAVDHETGECRPPEWADLPEDMVIKNNVFNLRNNNGIIYLQCVRDVVIENNIFYGSSIEGSVFDIRHSENINITNNTIANNSGLGLFSSGGSIGINFTNNIVTSNRSGVQETPGVDFAYNNSFGNTEFDYHGSGFGHGNISEDPIFVNPESPAGPDADFWTEDDGFRLEGISPSVDTGDSSLMTDPNGSRIDMGAYGGTELAVVSTPCTTPESGMEIRQDTIFCSGAHSVEGIAIKSSGTPDDSLKIACKPDARLDGSSDHEPIGISMLDRSQPEEVWSEYVRISSCVFQNYRIATESGAHVTYEYNEFINISEPSIVTKGGAKIKNNYFHNTVSPSSSQYWPVVNLQGSHNVLENNIFENVNAAIFFNTPTGLPEDECPLEKNEGLEIRKNVFDTRDMSIIQTHCVENVIIENNLFYGHVGTEGAVFDLRFSDNIDIINNTVAYNSGASLYCTCMGAPGHPTSTNVNFKNNIAAYNRSGFRGDQGIDHSYNNSFGNQEYDYHIIEPGQDGNISADPLFANPENPAGPDNKFWTKDDGFRLIESSPSVDTGDASMTDPDGSPIDMGAYGGTDLATAVPDCIEPTKGMIINKDTTFCPGPYSFNLQPFEVALKVETDNITITCQEDEFGQTTSITNLSSRGVGLFNNGNNNVVIQGCTFKGFNFGMMVRNSENVMLRNVLLTENKRGIQFAQSHNNLIRNSEIKNNSVLDISVFHGNLTIDTATSEYDPNIFTFGGEVEVSAGIPEDYYHHSIKITEPILFIPPQ